MSLRALNAAILTAGLMAAPIVTNAQIEKPNASGYVGVLLGYADPTNMDGRFGYGVDFGLMFPNAVTGVLFAYSSSAETDGTDVVITQYGLGADYSLANWFDGFLGSLKGGIKLGMSTLDVDAPGADDGSEFFVGPSLGFDRLIADGFSIGAQSDLLFVTADPGYSTLYLWLTGKYWF
jgi:hypothetical protein